MYLAKKWFESSLATVPCENAPCKAVTFADLADLVEDILHLAFIFMNAIGVIFGDSFR
jgi:hypothetical protein